ncbi:MAG TPA: acyl-CoA dehydrogenase family protein, partial [Thermomicrobiales bacterium]|nr:acyl-CoA dehydrogenase family protein [Thermomicrobiales bacterium]
MPSTPPRLSVADPLNLEAEYTSEERALRDRVRAFAETELLPNIQSWWDSETIPRDLILEYGKLGILSLMHRGEDTRHTIAYGLVNAELEAVDAGLRTLFSVQCG